MHSSRMRTGRLLTVCRSLLRGGGLLPGVSALLWGGGVCSWEVGVGFCGIPAYTEADTPPCEQNDKQVQKYYLGHNFVAVTSKKSLFIV